MSSLLQFNDDASKHLMAMYLTSDMIKQRKQIIEIMKLQPGERALDVGSGPGFLASEIGKMVGSSGQVCGVDISETLLQVAKARGAHQPWVEFHNGDAARLPYADHNIGTLDRFLRAIRGPVLPALGIIWVADVLRVC